MIAGAQYVALGRRVARAAPSTLPTSGETFHDSASPKRDEREQARSPLAEREQEHGDRHGDVAHAEHVVAERRGHEVGDDAAERVHGEDEAEHAASPRSAS